jgi:HK97 family phage portal protein
MTLLRSLVARLTQPRTDPSPRRVGFTPRTTAGVWIDADTALRTDTVWACIRYLTSAVGQLPWRVMLEEAPGRYQWQGRHPANYLLDERPCPETGAFTWRETLLADALVRGNGYAEIQRDMAGRVVAMWPIEAHRVQVRRREDTGALFYLVTNSTGGQVELEPESVFHLRGVGNGVVGLSVVEFAAQSIGHAQAAQLFGAAFFGQGMTPAGVLSTAQALSPEAKGALDEEFGRLYGGVRGAHRTVIVDAGMSWSAASVQPNEAQFVETMQFQVEAICRWFGVPPHKVQHLARSTNNNIESQAIEVVTDAVMPWVRRFEEEADHKVFGMNRMGLFTRMDLTGLLRGDVARRGEYYQRLVGSGVMSLNEVRAMEDLNPIPGGDVHMVPVNMMPLQRMLAPPAPAAPPTPPSAPAEPTPPDEDGAAAILLH